MAKKKTTTSPKLLSPPASKATRQSAATAHELEFAKLVMAPKFLDLLENYNFDLSYTTMTTAYNAAYDTRLSASTIKKYLDVLGWKYERKPQWTGLPRTTAVPIPDETNTDTVNPAAILHGPFDDETNLGSSDVASLDDVAHDILDKSEQGHTIGGPLPGQGKLSPSELELLG